MTGGFFKELDPNAICYWTLHPMLSCRELTLQLSMKHAESELNILKLRPLSLITTKVEEPVYSFVDWETLRTEPWLTI